MKKKLLLLLIGYMMSLLCIAQESSEEKYDPNVTVLSRGIIYSKGTSSNSPSMYIKGSLKVVSKGTTYVENSRMKLTGDFINDNTSENPFLNKSPKERVSYVPGIVEFCGLVQQLVTTTGSKYDNSPTKKRNWVGFPSLDINNENQVLVDARMGVKTQDIILTKGWLILDSRLADTTLDDSTLDPDNQTVSAHLLVEGSVDYKSDTWASAATPEERGFIEVRLKVPTDTGDDKSVVGFGSPFNKLRADYFMFNTLLIPQWGITDGTGFLKNKSIIDPRTVLEAGRGYALAIDVNGTDPDKYPPKYSGISFEQRATDGYRFNRHVFTELAPANQYHGTDVTADAYQDEKLNTDDITLTLQAGYNYLSNPYTCPLDISELIQDDTSQSSPPVYTEGMEAPSWGTDMHVGVAANHPPILNKVWILNPTSKVTPTDNINVGNYTITYQVAMNTGGTYTGAYEYDNFEDPEEASETLVAPLQMFVLRAYSTVNDAGREFKIPKSERRTGGIPFLRSSRPARSDDFIFEFRDAETKTTDRLSLVVRHEEELIKSNYANVERVEVSTVEKDESLRFSTESFDFTQKLGSQVYTKDASGTPLTVQFLPLESTKSIVLYHIPSSQIQALQIVGLRIGTKDRVRYMWLEDTKEKTLTEVSPGMFYETTSSPGDSPERFVLHLNEVTSIEEIAAQATIYAYREGNSIVVTGLTDSDQGNTLSLYDMSGKLLSNKVVGGTKEYFSGVRMGVYIIRMTGSRTQVVKLIAQ